MGYIGFLAVLIPVVAIIGGFAVAIVSMIRESRIKELQIRERITLIEKGLVPSPEQNPAAFEAAWLRTEEACCGVSPSREAYATKCTRAGIILIGIGLMLMVIITFAGDASHAGVGVGGGVAVLGGAFLVCGAVERLSASRAARLAPSQPAKPRAGERGV